MKKIFETLKNNKKQGKGLGNIIRNDAPQKLVGALFPEIFPEYNKLNKK